MQIKIQLFREIAIQSGESRLADWRSDVSRRLIARLALNPGEAVSRRRLIRDLWPHEAHPPANRLAVAVYQTKRSLDAFQPGWGDILMADVKSVWLNPGICQSDWSLVEKLRAERSLTGAADACRRIAELTQGPFLPGIDDLWTAAPRARAEATTAACRFHLAEEALLAGRTEEAESLLGQVLISDSADPGRAISLAKSWVLGLQQSEVRAQATQSLHRISPGLAESVRPDDDALLCLVVCEHPIMLADGSSADWLAFPTAQPALDRVEHLRMEGHTGRVLVDICILSGSRLPPGIRSRLLRLPPGQTGIGAAMEALLVNAESKVT